MSQNGTKLYICYSNKKSNADFKYKIVCNSDSPHLLPIAAFTLNFSGRLRESDISRDLMANHRQLSLKTKGICATEHAGNRLWWSAKTLYPTMLTCIQCPQMLLRFFTGGQINSVKEVNSWWSLLSWFLWTSRTQALRTGNFQKSKSRCKDFGLWHYWLVTLADRQGKNVCFWGLQTGPI